jgi:transketolase
MALSNRMDGLDARVFCLLGDGECSEGSVWEAAQFAGDQGLANLVALVDVNGLQQSEAAPYGQDTGVYARRFQAFGWDAVEIDGHDMPGILRALRRARDSARPTAVVARTVKGKGVALLEGAQGWHGKPLDETQMEQALAELGEAAIELRVEPRRLGAAPVRSAVGSLAIPVRYERAQEVATRSAFGEALRKLGERVPGLVVIDGDVKNSTKTEAFGQAFPERLIESQIAEQNMVGAALGLAASGRIPCVATFAAFLSRAYDFIRMAGHSRPEHLIFCGSHAGISIGEDGPSQMGLEDIAMFRAIDGSTILYPCDAVSAERLTEQAVLTPGIVYLRTTRGKTPVIYADGDAFPVGGSRVLRSSPQDRLTLVAAGVTVHSALEAHDRLLQRGVHTRVIDAYSVKPLDVQTLQGAARETEALIVVEDHSLYGGLGDAVSAEIGRIGRVFRLGVTGEPRSGSPAELMERHRISSRAIEQEALAVAA